MEHDLDITQRGEVTRNGFDAGLEEHYRGGGEGSLFLTSNLTIDSHNERTPNAILLSNEQQFI